MLRSNRYGWQYSYFNNTGTGIFAWNYSIIFIRIIGGFRIRNYIENKNQEFIILKENHNELVKLISEIKNEKIFIL